MTCLEKKFSNHVKTVSSTDLPLSNTSSKSLTCQMLGEKSTNMGMHQSRDLTTRVGQLTQSRCYFPFQLKASLLPCRIFRTRLEDI